VDSALTNMLSTVWLLLSGLGLSIAWKSYVFLGPGEGSQQPEIVTLPLGEAPPCQLNIDPFPVRVEGSVAFLTDSGLIGVVGGGTTSIYALDSFFGTWEKGGTKSDLPYDIFGGQGAWFLGEAMIIGGVKVPGDKTVNSTLILRDQVWIEGPAMPTPLADFCLVKMNETHLLIVGGGNEDQYPDSKVFMFDGSTFQPMSGLLQPRAVMGCSLNSEGEVVVAGGFGPSVDGGDPDGEPMDSVEIYHPDSDTWRPGPTLPKPMGFFAGMTKDGDKVLLMGGNDGKGYTKDIHSLEVGADTWVLEETKLREEHGYSPSFTDPLLILEC